MTDKQQNPELIRFKTFINDHPKLIKQIRRDGRSWQEIYEQWVLLGEEDEHWNQYKEKQANKEEREEEKEGLFSKFELKPELVKQVLKYTETIDINKLQEQVHQLSKTVATVQEIVNQHQKTNRPNERPVRGFDWFMD